MGFEWDPEERADFDAKLVAHLAAQFPEATFEWTGNNRRLLITFPEGAVCSIYEPNFFFSYPSFTLDHLFGQVVDAITAQREQLRGKA